MSLYLVTYDAVDGDDRKLAEHLQAQGSVQFMDYQWIMPSHRTAEEIYGNLKPLFGKDDRFIVVEVYRDAHWENLLVSDDIFAAFLRGPAGE